jgi:hypothetical protein
MAEPRPARPTIRVQSAVGSWPHPWPNVEELARVLDWVAAELNDRPRKRLAFKKPIEEIGPLLLR